MVTADADLLDAPTPEELSRRYARALAEMPQPATQQVSALRRVYLRRRRELGVAPLALEEAPEAIEAPTPDLLPPRSRFRRGLSWFFMTMAVVWLLRMLIRGLGG